MILVTGATGHIGNVLVRALLEGGNKVRAMILPGEDRTPIKNLDVEIVEGNVLDPESLSDAMDGAKDVFHLAGVISIQPGQNDLVRQVNVQGTKNILKIAAQKGIRRLVYTSSIHAIVRAPEGVEINEGLPFDPCNCAGEYDRSKAEASLAVLEAAQEGLDTVIACPTGVIGPYDYRRSEMGQYILDCMRRKIQLWIDGAYDFVDVRDVARGLILAWQKGRKGECYILSGEQISLARLAKIVGEYTGARQPGLRIPLPVARLAAFFAPLYSRLAKTRPLLTAYSLKTVLSNSCISHAKARTELGYMPRPIYLSIADTVRWFRQNRLLTSANSLNP